MAGAIRAKLKPKQGFSHFFHILFYILLPVVVFVLIRISFYQVALAVILLSKWRMIAVRPRHWPANFRANAIDIIVGFSLVGFMLQTESSTWQLIWSAGYGLWLIVLKPVSTPFGVTLQAMIGQLLGLVALFLVFPGASRIALVGGAWFVAYISARHFMSSFDEPLTRFLAHFWGYLAAALTWILSHWLLFYVVVAQPALILTILGYGLATLYYLQETDKLSAVVRREIMLVMSAALIIILAFSDWGDKAI